MKDKKEVKNLIILAAVLLVFTSAYLIINKLTSKENIKIEEYLKNYEVNEYIPAYVSDESMAKIYLNHYINIMHVNPEKAYNLLDVEYRNKKFSTFDDYKNYINSFKYSTYELDRFYVESKDGYKFYGVYDTNGNMYIFKTKGVMQYTIYLDDYTVEI